VQGPALAAWLLRHGCPDPAVRSLVWHNDLYRLDIDATLDLLAGSTEELEQLLGERLGRLLEPG
jgi:hypothetical protein